MKNKKSMYMLFLYSFIQNFAWANVIYKCKRHDILENVKF